MPRFTETARPRHQFCAGLFPRRAAVHVDRGGAFRLNAGITVAEIDLRFLSDFLGDAQVGKAAFAYVVDPKGQVLASSTKGPEIGKDLSGLPQVAALLTPDGAPLASGTDADGHSVLTTASAVPKLGWYVFFEQPTAQALSPIRDQLVRIALLIALGLVVAIIAGSVLARRMLVPITALRTGARRLGAGEFGHRIDVHTADELEELATQFNSMAGQLAETYSDLEWKVKERTRDLAQSINELKVLEEVGRAVSSSLDLNAVLPTVAARALEITHADAVLIYGYDAANHQFNLTEAIGIDKIGRRRPPRHRRGRQPARRGRRACRADRDPQSRRDGRSSAARCRGRGRLPFGAGGAAGRPEGRAGIAGGAAQERRRIFRQPDRADEDLCASIGAGDAQCAAVHGSRPQEPRTGDRALDRAPAGRQAAGADRPAQGLEQVAGGAGRDATRRNRAHPPTRTFPGAAGGATDRLLRRP